MVSGRRNRKQTTFFGDIAQESDVRKLEDLRPSKKKRISNEHFAADSDSDYVPDTNGG